MTKGGLKIGVKISSIYKYDYGAKYDFRVHFTLRTFVCHDAQKVVVRPHVRDSAVHRADF